jgi:hypothetical protein
MSRLCCFLCFSRSSSFLNISSSTFLPSSIKKPPFELTIFDKSYSTYVPSRESRFNGLKGGATGAVGEPCPAGVMVNERLLLELTYEEDDASCSF